VDSQKVRKNEMVVDGKTKNNAPAVLSAARAATLTAAHRAVHPAMQPKKKEIRSKQLKRHASSAHGERVILFYSWLHRWPRGWQRG
jgi:hypothetical protein